MAQTRVNGGAAAANHIGGDLNFVKVPCGGAVNGKHGVGSTVPAIVFATQEYANVVALCLSNSNQDVEMICEGGFGWSQATLQTAIRALGTVDSIDLSGVTPAVHDAWDSD